MLVERNNFNSTQYCVENYPINSDCVLRKSDINWALQIEKKVKNGYSPSEKEIKSYNTIVDKLYLIKSKGGYIYQDTVTISNKNSRNFLNPGSTLGNIVSGGIIAHKYSAEVATATKSTIDIVKAEGLSVEPIKYTASNLVSTTLKTMGLSALISGGISTVSNLINIVAGRVKTPEAVGNIVADTLTSTVTGLGALVTGGVGSLALSCFGIAGLPLTIGSIALGAIGAVLTDKLIKKVGVHDAIRDNVKKLFN